MGSRRHTYAGYDLDDHATQTDAEGRTTRWEYDAMGRVTSRILPEGQFETFANDLVGNVIEHRDFNGNITVSTYDSNNRLLRRIPQRSTLMWQ